MPRAKPGARWIYRRHVLRLRQRSRADPTRVDPAISLRAE